MGAVAYLRFFSCKIIDAFFLLSSYKVATLKHESIFDLELQADMLDVGLARFIFTPLNLNSPPVKSWWDYAAVSVWINTSNIAKKM